MGEYEPSYRGPDWKRAEEFVNSIYENPDDAVEGDIVNMIEMPMPPDSTTHGGQSAADKLARLVANPSYPIGIALERLMESKIVDFDLKRDPENDEIQPILSGSVNEQNVKATKINSFLDRHSNLIAALSFIPDEVVRAVHLEDQGELPEGYASRFRANSLLYETNDAEMNHEDNDGETAKLALMRLLDAGVKPLSTQDIDDILDAAIETDSQKGLFD